MRATAVAAVAAAAMLAGSVSAHAAVRAESAEPSDRAGSIPAQNRPSADDPEPGSGTSGSIFDLLPDETAQLEHPVDRDGRVTVEVYVEPGASLDEVQSRVAEELDVVTVSSEFGVLTGSLPSDRVDALRDVPGVRSVVVPPPPSVGGGLARSAPQLLGKARTAPTDGIDMIPAPACRAVPVEADAPLDAATAREVFGVDGSGVTIGVISDSFDVAIDAATTPEEDVELGSLPGAANPCGYRTEVTVVRDADPSSSWASDEGRAMTQLVHGIAPGAELLFANAGDTMYDMADAIDLLVEAGADLIVDDISFYGSPMYQQGPIDSAIARARGVGVSHYSSAGNSSLRALDDGPQVGSWMSSAFVATECPAALAGAVSADGCMNFGTTADPDPTNRISYTSSGGSGPSLILQWAEPWYGVEAPLAVLALTTDDAPQVVGFGLCENTSEQPLYTCDQSFASLPLGTQVAIPAGESVELDLVVVRILNEGVEPGSLPSPGIRLQVMTPADDMGLEHDESRDDGSVLVGPTLSVNNAGPNVFTVGAAPYDDANELREFSAFGPYWHLFEPLASTEPGIPAAPLDEPWVRPGPDAVSVDGVQTSFFMPAGAGEFRFTGTSAAAPHAAAIATLVRSAHVDAPLSVEAEFDALRAAGSPVSTHELPGVDQTHATGGGLIDAAAALALSDASTDRLWAAPVPPDEIPATVEGLRESACDECAPVLPSTLDDDGVLTVDAGDFAGGNAFEPGDAFEPADAFERRDAFEPGQWVWLFGYSEPVNLGWVTFDDDRSFSVDVSHLGEGDHTLAMFHGTREVIDDGPILVAMAEFTLPGPGPGPTLEPTPEPTPAPTPAPGPGPNPGPTPAPDDSAIHPAARGELANSGFDAVAWPLIGGVLALMVGSIVLLATPRPARRGRR